MHWHSFQKQLSSPTVPMSTPSQPPNLKTIQSQWTGSLFAKAMFGLAPNQQKSANQCASTVPLSAPRVLKRCWITTCPSDSDRETETSEKSSTQTGHQHKHWETAKQCLILWNTRYRHHLELQLLRLEVVTDHGGKGLRTKVMSLKCQLWTMGFGTRAMLEPDRLQTIRAWRPRLTKFCRL